MYRNIRTPDNLIDWWAFKILVFLALVLFVSLIPSCIENGRRSSQCDTYCGKKALKGMYAKPRFQEAVCMCYDQQIREKIYYSEVIGNLSK